MFFQNIDVAARVYAIFGLEMVNGSTSRVSTEKSIHNKNIFLGFKLNLILNLNLYMIRSMETHIFQ